MTKIKSKRKEMVAKIGVIARTVIEDIRQIRTAV